MEKYLDNLLNAFLLKDGLRCVKILRNVRLRKSSPVFNRFFTIFYLHSETNEVELFNLIESYLTAEELKTFRNLSMKVHIDNNLVWFDNLTIDWMTLAGKYKNLLLGGTELDTNQLSKEFSEIYNNYFIESEVHVYIDNNVIRYSFLDSDAEDGKSVWRAIGGHWSKELNNFYLQKIRLEKLNRIDKLNNFEFNNEFINTENNSEADVKSLNTGIDSLFTG